MADTVYAQILNGVVMNTIVLNDVSLVGLFTEGFDALVEITALEPQPWIGWHYDGTNFTPPT